MAEHRKDAAAADEAATWASIASLEQERVYNDEASVADPGRYRLLAAWRVRGPLRVDSLNAAVSAVGAAHESLRTHFQVIDDELHQVVTERPLTIEHVDLTPRGPDRASAEADRLLRREDEHVFDLSRPGLVRVLLVKLERQSWMFVINAHHIVVDEWSIALLLDQISAAYAQHATTGEPSVPVAPAYADYAQWQRDDVARTDSPSSRFWRDVLSEVEELRLPQLDGWQRADRRTETVEVPVGVSSADVARTARSMGTTPHALGLAAVLEAHATLAHQTVPVVVCPTANRSLALTHEIVGLFVNLLPIAVDVRDWSTPRRGVDATTSAWRAALRHESLPFQDIAAQAPVSPSALLVTTYFLHQPGDSRFVLHGCSAEEIEVERDVAQFDLTIGLDLSAPQAQIRCNVNAARFDEVTARTVCGRAAAFVRACVDSPNGLAPMTIVDAPALTPVAVSPGRDRPLLESFYDHVTQTPQALAVTEAGATVTYEQASRGARALREELEGTDPDGAPVVLLLERGTAAVLAMLATASRGVAYVPIDPRDPLSRQHHIAQSVGARVVVGYGPAPELCQASGFQYVDVAAVLKRVTDATELLDVRPCHPLTLLAVLHTSGSTGEPKGVVVTHRSVSNLLRDQRLQIGAGQAVALASTLAFDAATFEVWGAMTAGAHLIAVPRPAMQDADELRRMLAGHPNATMFVTTAVFNHLVRQDPQVFAGLARVVTGGEDAQPDSFRAVAGNATAPVLLHAYGPTETTTFATLHTVGHVPDRATAIALGEAVGGTSVVVRDLRTEVQEPGHVGEIFIGGRGVSSGYWARPRATAAVFLPDPDAATPGDRMYRTGDLAVRGADGSLHFAGRTDRQVKVRGQRVEVGAVERSIVELPGVTGAAVVAVANEWAEQELLCWVESKRLADDLRTALLDLLPPYAVPATITVFDRLPLTPSGKVDRRAVAEARVSVSDVRTDASSLDARVVAAWEQALGRPPMDVQDDFFRSGGHSLSAVRMLDALRTSTGIEISIRAFLSNPTVAQLCAEVADDGPSDGSDVISDGADTDELGQLLATAFDGER